MRLLETIRSNFNVGALGITVLTCALLVMAVALIARKAEGRPVRDTLALVGSGIVLVLALMPIAIASADHDLSPEVAWLLRQFDYLLFFAIAYLVWWAGNKLSHRMRPRKKKGPDNRAAPW